MIRELGKFAIFLFKSFSGIPYIFKRPSLFAKEIYRLGLLSLPIAAFTSLFVGIVTALQTYYQMGEGIPSFFVGVTSTRTIMIELAPVVISLVVGGKIGAFVAAEIGTMKITEQIDALKTLGINPYHFLALPVIFAGILVMPILVIFSEFISITSAGVSSFVLLGVRVDDFIYGMKRFFSEKDLFGGLFKTVIFGFIITSSAAYYGMNTGYGAEAVGRSTTYAVVTAASLILVFDFLVAFLVFR